MEVLESHSRNDASGTLIYCADGSLILGKLFFCGGGVHNHILYQFIYSIVKIILHKDSFPHHTTYGIDLHNRLKYLLNCLAVRVGICSTVTNLMLCDLVIKNGVPFTNIKYATRVTNLFNSKNP